MFFLLKNGIILANSVFKGVSKLPYNFEERYNEIREQLISQGYANKHITYSEFLAIYESYKEEMSEKEFIQVLGISYASWQSMKNQGTRAIILKREKSEDEKKESEELKQMIVSDLIQKGYQNKLIDYKEFLRLYEPYRGKLKESEFANILGISYPNFKNIKNYGQRAIILKKEKSADEKKELEEIKKFIVSDLIKKGYGNKLIDYNEFLRLYEPYKEKFKEKEFAHILGISYENWQYIKNKGGKTTILKKELSKNEKKELEQLKQFVVSDIRKRGYTNKKIDYNEFLRLYESYKEKFSESEFANILGISYENWIYLKNKGGKTTILKKELSEDKKKELEQLKQFIISDLRKRGYTNKKIDYNEFLRLYEPYKEKFKESEFASVLGISYSSWRYIKYNKTRTIILKQEKSTYENKKLEELKKFIVSDLIQKGYSNKSIDYKEFFKLYEPYRKKLKENEFASVLGISYSSYKAIKYNGKRAIILKKEKTADEKKELEELKKFIVSDLIQKGYMNKSIDYKEFLRLYEPYRDKLKESEFACVLGISYSSWQAIKSKGKKAIILKREKSEDEKKELEELKKFIVSDLIKKGYANKLIDYKEFLRLYELYKEKFSESEFANILGISYVNLQRIKKQWTKASINFKYIYYLRLAHLFKENKEYDLEYFEKVSENLDLPILKIIEILSRERNLEELLNVLYERGKIFIGKTKISESFIQKYGEMISDIIHKYSKSIGGKLHTSFYSEDFAQETIIYLLENKGSIERNFEEDSALQRIIAYAKVRCKYMHYRVFSQKKVVSLDESKSEDGKLTRYKRIKAKENVQDEVEKREEEIEISEGDTPITVIQQCLINGMNREESLEFVMKKFGLSQEELLQVLTEELSKKNSIKVAQNGEVYLGGRDIDD